ncbi:MAG: Smr/MutS family protein [Vicinamibacterales bacterium]
MAPPGDFEQPFVPGDEVQTTFGKGVVRAVRNGGRVLVEVHGRAAILVAAASLRRVEPSGAGRRPARRTPSPGNPDLMLPARPGDDGAEAPRRVREVDLHGLRVEEAIVRVAQVVDGAIRDDVAEVRIIHGRGAGRLRAAVQQQLRAIGSIRSFGLDPRNPGVTVVRL